MGGPANLHSDLHALVGTVIHDRYRVESLLGVGGMGAVFRAHHLGLRRDVALKVLHPEIGGDESVTKRFDREATSASRLDHPNCVRVSDFGTTENGTKYLVMEFLEGHELKDSLGKPLAPVQAIRIAIQIFQALEHAHHFGVVHRDLKPENIFVTTDFRGHEVVKIVDFGIAKLIDDQGAHEKLTRAGLVFGTPRYMSPEQAAGGKIDERTDIYAAGLILYEMLCGNVPFDSDEPGQLLRMQIIAPPPPLPASVPEPLAKLVEKLLEKSKADRHASAREVIDALTQLERELTSVPVPVPVPTTSLPPAPPPPAEGFGMHVTVPPPPAAPSFPGMPVSAPTYPSTYPTPYPSAQVVVAPPQREPSRKPWLVWVIVGAALFLALMITGAVISANPDESDTAPTPKPRSPSITPPVGLDDAARDDEDEDEDEREDEREAKKREEERKREEKKRKEERKREKWK